MLVGNKSDLKHLRAVATEDAAEFASMKSSKLNIKTNQFLIDKIKFLFINFKRRII